MCSINARSQSFKNAALIIIFVLENLGFHIPPFFFSYEEHRTFEIKWMSTDRIISDSHSAKVNYTVKWFSVRTVNGHFCFKTDFFFFGLAELTLSLDLLTPMSSHILHFCLFLCRFLGQQLTCFTLRNFFWIWKWTWNITTFTHCLFA